MPRLSHRTVLASFVAAVAAAIVPVGLVPPTAAEQELGSVPVADGTGGGELGTDVGVIRQVDADGDELWSYWEWAPPDSLGTSSSETDVQPLDWQYNPATGHYYALVVHFDVIGDMSLWDETETYAVHLGGHLATVNDSAEDRWISATFKDAQEIGVGLNDRAREGHWVWSSGERVAYTNWLPGEPTDNDDQGHSEDIVEINAQDEAGAKKGWNDVTGDGLELFLIEVPALPTTGWLTGRVTAGGEPVAGANVKVQRLDPAADSWSQAEKQPGMAAPPAAR